jgi:hypothetical protein
MSEMREIRLSADLCSAAEQRFGAKFAKIEDLLEFLLRELLRDESVQADQEEQRMLEQRLRDLGYL